MKAPSQTHLSRQVAVVVAWGLFLWGVVHLFGLRYEKGDVYPHYSSLRTDPLGSSLLYDSLDKLGNLQVERNFRQKPEWVSYTDSVQFIVGVNFELLSVDENAEQLREFVGRGGRCIVSLFPQTFQESRNRFRNSKKKDEEEKEDSKDTKDIFDFNAKNSVKLRTFDSHHGESLIEVFDHRLSWNSAYYFEDLDQSWKVIAQKRGEPVIIEKAYGQGSLVLIADSYALSNEANAKAPPVHFLSWLVGSKTRVVFDETAHGIVKHTGIMDLIKRYNLGGFFIGLCLILLLYLWHNTFPFIPVDTEDSKSMSGINSDNGLVNLLKNHVPSSRIIATCVEVWKKSESGRGMKDPDKLEQIQRIVKHHEAKASDTEETTRAYQQICQVIKDKRI